MNYYKIKSYNSHLVWNTQYMNIAYNCGELKKKYSDLKDQVNLVIVEKV